jgi:hypothetical protein
MVGQMTYGKRQWDEFDSQMRKLIPVVTSASNDMIKMIDADTNAFNDYMVRKVLKIKSKNLLLKKINWFFEYHGFVYLNFSNIL